MILRDSATNIKKTYQKATPSEGDLIEVYQKQILLYYTFSTRFFVARFLRKYDLLRFAVRNVYHFIFQEAQNFSGHSSTAALFRALEQKIKIQINYFENVFFENASRKNLPCSKGRRTSLLCILPYPYSSGQPRTFYLHHIFCRLLSQSSRLGKYRKRLSSFAHQIRISKNTVENNNYKGLDPQWGMGKFHQNQKK